MDYFLPTTNQNGKMRPLSIIEYCTEEVRRQGHDVTKPEGLRRVAWMLEAWSLAMEQPTTGVTQTLIEDLGILIEPDRNLLGYRGYRQCSVRVGGFVMPPWQDVPLLIEALVEFQDTLSAADFYRAFLKIHPFEDGSGRVGKILLNLRLSGLTGAPVFPPNDFWGGWIVNP